jgi:S-adenosylmethionine decarboxylase
LNHVISAPSADEGIKATAIPGLHIIANLSVSNAEKLVDSSGFKAFIDLQISEKKLSKVGEVFHSFPNGAYTAVICLTESHLSIHTWPENNYLTFDIFLSNYLKDNRKVTHDIYREVVEFFEGEIVLEQFIDR